MKKTILSVAIAATTAFGAQAVTFHQPNQELLDHLGQFGITQENWDNGEYTSMTFMETQELLRHALISPSDNARTFEKSSKSLDMSTKVADLNGQELTLESLLRDRLQNRTMIVLQDGKLVHEHYWSGTNKDTLQIVQSITKSFASSLMAIAEKDGHLKMSDPITKYLPEAKGTVIEGSPIQFASDMRTGFALIDAANENSYSSDWDLSMANALGWYGDKGEWVGVKDYTPHLTKKAYEAGKKFEYHSYNTEVLGVITARATGQNWSNYFEDMIWKRGQFASKASIIVDREQTPAVCGGLSMTARDAATMGDIWAHDGKSQNGTQVVPKEFLDSVWAGNDEVREAWTISKESALADGFYKDQFRVLNLGGKEWLTAIGVHGQIIAVEKDSKTVITMFSNYSEPSSARLAVGFFHTAIPAIEAAIK
ncbi:serine hydrolase domain-containing protein [Vibrio jasicida]|uniref:serine hydrolase domain-containing protein n=1 Tax=Vibrio jasicida TaxID=766224 RepID=UPI000CE4C841|nr:serine hydrolase [Vibrio jasicida]